MELQKIESRQDEEPFFLMQKAYHTGDQYSIRAKLESVIDACLQEDETLLDADDDFIVDTVYARLGLSSLFQRRYDSMDAKHAVISSQSDINEEASFSEPVHGLHTSIVASSDQETCLSESICDVDAHLECSLGVEHEENAYVTLHAKEIVLDDAIQEGFMSMAAFQDTGDDVDLFDAQTYVFDVNQDKDYDYGDAYSEGVMDDDQSMTAIGYREEDMELMDLLDDALEEFRVPYDKSSEEHPATYDEELMFLLDEALEEFVPTREGSH
ncbi:hypothetical protein GOP47_0025854 [Adiantum capillus-veneris]|uniref:Uncharacterized protein n=1 Tax=Adiantum capillus-veneris TaxID=13818 RepID=A0A9D4U244_ADICA|nr:hypothetical protein GOP47_0025854 [Adiantum capillus-veneris]